MALESRPATGRADLARQFDSYQRLSVRQRKKWLEIILAFEAKNAYDVFDETNRAVLQVREEGTGLWRLVKRLFLGPVRPFEASVTSVDTGALVLKLDRPWRWIFARLDIASGDGTPLGAIEREWSWIRRIYKVTDASGNPVAKLFGPFLKPWTFEIHGPDGQVIGAIKKKWSGIGKEMFTDADNFAVELDHVQDGVVKALVFAATVLVDVVHFERAKS